MAEEVSALRADPASADPTPETADPIDLAMQQEREDTAPDSPARRVLLGQEQLIASQVALIAEDRRHRRWQIASERWGVTLKLLTVMVGVAAAGLLGAMVVAAARSNAVIVQSFDAPPLLAGRGLTGKVVASGLQDGLTRIQAATRTVAARREISNAWTGDIAVEVPQTGVSLGEIDRLLRERLGRNIYVSGDLVQAEDGGLALTVRGDGVLPRSFTGPPDQLGELTTQAAEYVYGSAEPYLFSTYLIQARRYEEAIAFLAASYPAAEDSIRSQLANNWGVALNWLGRYAEGAAKFRLAIQLDPTFWRAWGNLVGVLFNLEGEEAAFRVGMEMRRRAAAVPANKKPEPITEQNINLLAQEWTDYIAGAVEDARQSGGGSTMQAASPGLAEAEARRHDWKAAFRYLEATDPADTMGAPTRLLVAGYQALEAGQPARAVPPLERYDAAWRADPVLAFTYGDAPCWLARAYALSGRRAEAEAVFRRMGRWVSCYAFHAEGLEAAGDRRAADAAFARAVALAPSLPFAYHRWGVALLNRGDLAGAQAKFAQAHARGPRWADPLEALGDVAARRGRWKEAERRYRQAAAFAPGWIQLHRAWAVALDRIGRRKEAAETIGAGGLSSSLERLQASPQENG